MDIHPEQHMVVVKTAQAWIQQARAAMAEIKAANGGRELACIGDGARVAPAAFGSLIEAMVALEPLGGHVVGADLIALAGLRPVDEVMRG